jgi:hypothetical protein
MSMRLVCTAVLLAVVTSSAQAASTIIGPTKQTCKDVTSSVENANLTLMWAAGFLSGVNRLGKRDFLEGKSIGDIVDMFWNVCLEKPDLDVEHATISVAARFRILLLKPDDLK